MDKFDGRPNACQSFAFMSATMMMNCGVPVKVLATQGVMKKGFEVHYCIKRDEPPFIFEREIGCEEPLKGMDALDGHESGVVLATLKWRGHWPGR